MECDYFPALVNTIYFVLAAGFACARAVSVRVADPVALPDRWYCSRWRSDVVMGDTHAAGTVAAIAGDLKGQLALHHLNIGADDQGGFGSFLHVVGGKAGRDLLEDQTRRGHPDVGHLGDDGVHHPQAGQRQAALL